MAVSFVLKFYLSETRILRETVSVGSLTDFTFEALCKCARRVLPNVNVSSFKWKDEEGELISLETDDHLLEALRSMQSANGGKDYLRIYPTVVIASDEPDVVDCVLAPQVGACATQASATIQDITVNGKPKSEALSEVPTLEPLADVGTEPEGLGTDYLRITDGSSQDVQSQVCADGRRICSTARTEQCVLDVAANPVASKPSNDENSRSQIHRVSDATPPGLLAADVVVKIEPIDVDAVVDQPHELAAGVGFLTGSTNTSSSRSSATTRQQSPGAKQQLSPPGSSSRVPTAALKLNPGIAAILNDFKASVCASTTTTAASAPSDRPAVDPLVGSFANGPTRDELPSRISSGKQVDDAASTDSATESRNGLGFSLAQSSQRAAKRKSTEASSDASPKQPSWISALQHEADVRNRCVETESCSTEGDDEQPLTGRLRKAKEKPKVAHFSKRKKKFPTDNELKKTVQAILRGADLEKMTMNIVCEQVYGKFPLFDLSTKKRFIKETVKAALCECARRLLPNANVSSLKWKDEEGELISLETDDHLMEALCSMHCANSGKDYLRIYPTVVSEADEPVVVDCVLAAQAGACATQLPATIQDITVDVKPKLEPLDDEPTLEPLADIFAGHESLSRDYLRITDVSSQNVQTEICAADRRICSTVRNGQGDLKLATSQVASEPSNAGNSSQILHPVCDATQPELLAAEVLVLVKAEPIDDYPVADQRHQIAAGTSSQLNKRSPNTPIYSSTAMTTRQKSLVAKQQLPASDSSGQGSTAALKLKPNVAALSATMQAPSASMRNCVSSPKIAPGNSARKIYLPRLGASARRSGSSNSVSIAASFSAPNTASDSISANVTSPSKKLVPASDIRYLLMYPEQEREPMPPKVDKIVRSYMNLTLLTCRKCGEKAANPTKLRKHAIQHLDLVRFKCKLCAYGSLYRSHCMVHVKTCAAAAAKSSEGATAVADVDYSRFVQYIGYAEAMTKPILSKPKKRKTFSRVRKSKEKRATPVKDEDDN